MDLEDIENWLSSKYEMEYFTHNSNLSVSQQCGALRLPSRGQFRILASVQNNKIVAQPIPDNFIITLVMLDDENK